MQAYARPRRDAAAIRYRAQSRPAPAAVMLVQREQALEEAQPEVPAGSPLAALTKALERLVAEDIDQLSRPHLRAVLLLAVAGVRPAAGRPTPARPQ